jgi:hypothetical protein
MKIEFPKKLEPNPTKISLNHKPEKILPINKTLKAKSIPLPINAIF